MNRTAGMVISGRDGGGKYEIEVIGEVGRNSRLFRGMEFQESANSVTCSREFQEKAGPWYPCRYYFS